MSEVLPQSKIGPVVTKTIPSLVYRPSIINEEAARVKEILPTRTVWGRESGRPVYDRLPAISQQYVRDFYRDGQAFVYLKSRDRAVGAGTLQAGILSEDPGVLGVQSGTITWPYGQVDVSGYAVRLSGLNDGAGVLDGDYQVGYLLSYEEEEDVVYREYEVENFSLAGSKTVYGASSAAENFPVETAFTDAFEPGWRPNDQGLAGDYANGSDLILDFTEPVQARGFSLTAPTAGMATAAVSVYFSDDGVIWYLDSEWPGKEGKWEITVSEQAKHRYWKLFFWDGYVEVKVVKYSGTAFFPDQRPTGPTSKAEPYLDGKYEFIDTPHIILAELSVQNNQIVSVQDLREITYEKYEPVASWLTVFQDESLRKLFSDVETYSVTWMSPESAGSTIYDELLQEDSFEFGSDLNYPRLDLPQQIALKAGTYFTYDDVDLAANGDVTYYLDPQYIPVQTPTITTESQVILDTQDRRDIRTDAGASRIMYSFKGKSNEVGITTDPSSLQIQGDEVTVYESTNLVAPYHVTAVGSPLESSDLSTKLYVDTTFIVEMDNGPYD